MIVQSIKYKVQSTKTVQRQDKEVEDFRFYESEGLVWHFLKGIVKYQDHFEDLN